MNVILLGKPGSGKGTAGIEIAKDFNFKLISTGDLLRQEKSSGSTIGKQIESIMDRGDLVSDDIINDIIEQELSKPLPIDMYYLFDGYPRTISQARRLDEMLNISAVVYFDVDDATIAERIEQRGKKSGREDDQDSDTTKCRLENYYKDTQPVVDLYENSDRLYKVDASKSAISVYLQIKQLINKLNKEEEEEDNGIY